MKASLKATLEKAIEQWAEEAAEQDEWPEAYFHPLITDRMAQAAELVFDAAVETSQYTEEETTP